MNKHTVYLEKVAGDIDGLFGYIRTQGTSYSKLSADEKKLVDGFMNKYASGEYALAKLVEKDTSPAQIRAEFSPLLESQAWKKKGGIAEKLFKGPAVELRSDLPRSIEEFNVQMAKEQKEKAALAKDVARHYDKPFHTSYGLREYGTDPSEKTYTLSDHRFSLAVAKIDPFPIEFNSREPKKKLSSKEIEKIGSDGLVNDKAIFEAWAEENHKDLPDDKEFSLKSEKTMKALIKARKAEEKAEKAIADLRGEGKSVPSQLLNNAAHASAATDWAMENAYKSRKEVPILDREKAKELMAYAKSFDKRNTEDLPEQAKAFRVIYNEFKDHGMGSAPIDKRLAHGGEIAFLRTKQGQDLQDALVEISKNGVTNDIRKKIATTLENCTYGYEPKATAASAKPVQNKTASIE